MKWPVVLAVATLALGATLTSAHASATTIRPCAVSAVRVVDYNTLVGAGNVNDLFWIENVGRQDCSLRGYVHVKYVGHYGPGATGTTPAHLLRVDEIHTLGRDGNDVGGVRKGVALPTAILKRDGAMASFWIYGTDEPHNTPPSRCIVAHKMELWLPGAARSIAVAPMRSNGFFWCGGIAVHPIVAGKSGSDPPKALAYYFGVPGG